jgi:hypothetical protein
MEGISYIIMSGISIFKLISKLCLIQMSLKPCDSFLMAWLELRDMQLDLCSCSTPLRAKFV